MPDVLLAMVGTAATVVSIAVKAVGLPDQIRANAARRSTQGLSGPFVVLGGISYGLWTAYGALLGDLPLLLGQGAGLAAMGVIAWQMVRYRKAEADA